MEYNSKNYDWSLNSGCLLKLRLETRSGFDNQVDKCAVKWRLRCVYTECDMIFHKYTTKNFDVKTLSYALCTKFRKQSLGAFQNNQ